MQVNKSNRELRWLCIENHISISRKQHPNTDWIIALPAIKEGYYSFFLLPLRNDSSFEQTLSNEKDKYDNALAKFGQEYIDTLLKDALSRVYGTAFSKISTEIQATILWFLFTEFSNSDSNAATSQKTVEVFNDKKVVMLDFNLINNNGKTHVEH